MYCCVLLQFVIWTYLSIKFYVAFKACMAFFGLLLCLFLPFFSSSKVTVTNTHFLFSAMSPFYHVPKSIWFTNRQKRIKSCLFCHCTPFQFNPLAFFWLPVFAMEHKSLEVTKFSFEESILCKENEKFLLLIWEGGIVQSNENKVFLIVAKVRYLSSQRVCFY